MKKLLCALLLACFFSTPAIGETVEIYEASIKPWSGYWWPSIHGGMLTGVGYRGKPSVLDKLRAISPGNTDAVDKWYARNFYKPDGESWFGLCHAWSLAAINEPEPVRGGVYKGVPLNVGDKKAMLVLSHADDLCQKGNGADPLVFHQWILSFLRDQKKPFSANLQLSGTVSFFPVYRARVHSTDSSAYTDFRTQICYASDSGLPDFVGTKEGMRWYSYRLHKAGGVYVSGEWTGSSLKDYPGYLWNSLERHGPPVEGFDPATIDAAAQADTDDLSVGSIYPGSFSAFLEPGWGRPLEVEAGEWLELEFIFEDQYVFVPLTITDGGRIHEETVSQANPCIRYQCLNARPVLSLAPESRLTNSPFSLRFDLARDPLTVLTRRGATFSWGGLAGLCPLPEGGRTMATMRDREGRPLRSISLDTSGGEKFSRAFDLAEFDSWVFGRADQCEITSGRMSAQAALGAYTQGTIAFSRPVAGPQWVYGSASSSGQATSFHIRNNEARPVTGMVYGWDGRQIFSREETLKPHEIRFISWGNYPVPFPQGPSLFSIDFGASKVSLEACFVDRTAMEMVPATGEFARDFLFSHYPNEDVWSTTLHILNPHSTAGEVWLESVDGRRLHTIFVPPRRSAEIHTAGLPRIGQTLRVRSDTDMAAHVRYQAAGGDWAMLPLVRADRTAAEFLIPHVPDAPWWTGVILDHPGPESCEVVVEYFGWAGELLRTERRVLDGHEPWVFPTARSENIAYLKIRSSRALGCGVLYGSDDLTQLAGYVP